VERSVTTGNTATTSLRALEGRWTGISSIAHSSPASLPGRENQMRRIPVVPLRSTTG